MVWYTWIFGCVLLLVKILRMLLISLAFRFTIVKKAIETCRAIISGEQVHGGEIVKENYL